MTVRRGNRGTRPDQVITSADVIQGAMRGALFAVILSALLGSIVYVVSSRSTPIYSAQVGVVATQPGSQYGDLNIITPPTVDAGVYQSALLNGDVVADALARLEGARPSEERLERFLETVRVRVDASQRSSTIWIEVRNPSATYAADAVNGIADQLVVWDRERARRALDRSIAAIERSLGEIDAELAAAGSTDAERIATLTSLREQRTNELESALETSSAAMIVGLLEPLRTAAAPEEPIAPREIFSTLVAALLGLVVGYGLQIIAWNLDARVGGRDAVMTSTGLPVLAEFPMRPSRVRRHATEAAGFFHTNVALATRGAHPRAIVITSPTRTTEKAGVAISLAENFSRSGQRTLLVDADLRHPGVTEWLGVAPATTVSLETYLADHSAIEHAPLSVAIGNQQSFDFVPSSTSQRYPVDLLIEGFERCLKRWFDAYDVVILDSAPVVQFADTLTLAPACTGVVVCASARRSTRAQLSDALEQLQRPHINVLGVALTDARREARWSEGANRTPDRDGPRSPSNNAPKGAKAGRPSRA